MKSWVKVFLFISSYTPFFIIFILKNIANLNNSITCNTLFLFSLFVLVSNIILACILNNHIISPKQLKVKKVVSKNNEALNYIVAYIIPFIGFELANIYDLMSIIILFYIMCIIYISSNLIYINPILNIFGYKIYALIDVHNNSFILISRRFLDKKDINSFIYYEKIADNVILEAKFDDK